jgi:hypothetical protein
MLASAAFTRFSHVCVVDTLGPELLATWDYGQGSMRREAWALKPDQIEGCRRVRKLRPPVGGACIVEDGRRVQSVLPIEALHRFALQLETTP